MALENENIRELFDAVPVGTPVTINLEVRKRKSNHSRFGTSNINPPLILSPMAGVTDVCLPALGKRCGGVGLTVSEFISVEGLTRNNPNQNGRCVSIRTSGLCGQIFGGQPERMRMAAEMAEEVGAHIWISTGLSCAKGGEARRRFRIAEGSRTPRDDSQRRSKRRSRFL